MATKRPAEEAGGSGGPPQKKVHTRFAPVTIGPIYSLEELDSKVMAFQNKKLAERIDQRRKAEEELRKRIEQLENRQRTDDVVLMIVNRYWNQLDEDVRVLLQRFDAETADETENQNESNETTSFLILLSTWDKQEMEEKLGQRVEFSKRAIGKLLQTYDRLLQRNEKLYSAIRTKVEEETDDEKEAVSETRKYKEEQKGYGEDKEVKEGAKEETVKMEVEDKKLKEIETLSILVKQELSDLQRENKQLHNLVTQLHQRHHENTLKVAEFQDKIMSAETEIAELKNKVDDLEYDFDKSNQRAEKLDRHLAEAATKLQNFDEPTVIKEGGRTISGVSKNKFEEIITEVEEQRDLASNRLIELEKLSKSHQEALKEVERLKLALQQLPDTVVFETTEYKSLQSQFSVLYNESMQIKTILDDNRNLLLNNKNVHLRQIEQMECHELSGQKTLRTKLIQLEDNLAQVRKEYEMLRIEFEQNLAANEQTGPINREMRNLIQSLQNHNQQMKIEAGRYKRRLKEAQVDISRAKGESFHVSGDSTLHVLSSHSASKSDTDSIISKKDDEDKEEVDVKEKGKSDSEILKDVRAQLKKSQDNQKEMKLLLDMYKCGSKEQRDKVQLMAAEKKARQEIEDLKNHIRKMQEAERKEKRKLADEDAIRKLKKNEETINDLQTNLSAQKQREEALLNEMEVTGQAFEDMQEQNMRLLQTLKEKDDANFKLMTERIKSNQIHKLLTEEKEVLASQVTTLQAQVEAQNQVVRKLEEKERILQNNLTTGEKELSLRQQAMDMHRRKAVESSQTAADLKLHLDKYQAQLKEAQIAVAEKTGAIEQEAFKYKRMQEEIAIMRRKLERTKKIEMAGGADEVLMAEISEYKEQLTCPSCKVKRKDAVLTKCFHVFCLECLKTRYETRQRKCPKCNAGFGANDFHRLYIT